MRGMFALLFPLLLFSSSVHAGGILAAGRLWTEHTKEKFPEATYQAFLNLPRTNTGHVEAVLNRNNIREQPSLVFVDIREDIAVFFFRGVPGGMGFVHHDHMIYSDRTYVLEIRWKDAKTKVWHVWWNQQKLDQSFLVRPELWPHAENAPF